MCLEETVADANRDDDLKAFLDNEVSYVDFSISDGEPGLTLELNSGATVWKPVCVFRRRSENYEANSMRCVLSVEELTDQDELEFKSHAVTDAPGLVLHKENSRVWTPIAARTRSRLKHPNI